MRICVHKMKDKVIGRDFNGRRGARTDQDYLVRLCLFFRNFPLSTVHV